RVKNNLSVVLSIAQSMIASSETLAEFGDAFVARVRALADIHALLAEHRWEGIPLASVLDRVTAPYAPDSANRAISIEGPRVVASGDAASAVGMTAHELATNALKHGALSVPSGRVDIRWRLEPPRGDLCLEWTERGGPRIESGVREGFGMTLLQSI